MSKQSQGLIMFMIGLTHVAAVIMGLHTRYVKPSFGYALVVTGAALVVFGAWMIFEHAQDEKEADNHNHGDCTDHKHSHDHDHADCQEEHDHNSKVGWALFAPVVTFALILPPALGAAAVERQTNTGRKAAEATNQQNQDLKPLPEGDPVDLPMNVFWRHVFTDDAKTLKGRTVKITGFAMPQEGKDTWFLARMSVSCCAADAFAYTVQIKDIPAPKKDQWVEVTGTLDPDIPSEDDYRPPALNATSVKKVPEPEVPYLDPNA